MRSQISKSLAARALLAAGVVLLAGGCGGPNEAPDALGERPSFIPATTELLPTPTLALAGTFDPLRPPTPIVHPPLGTPAAETTPAAGEDRSGGTASAATTQPSPQPSPTIALPEGATARELVEFGQTAAAEGDQRTAAAAFEAALAGAAELDAAQEAEARLGLAVALLAGGRHDEAMRHLEALVQSPQDRSAVAKGGELVAAFNVADAAAFHLGQTRAATGDYAGAIEAYAAYMQNNPDMAAYVQPLIADAYQALGDTDGVIEALEAIQDAPAQRFKVVENRMRLANLYLERGNYAGAIAQYDAIHDVARTEATKGQMTFLAGQAEVMAGNVAAGQERFQRAIHDYPRAMESYHALVALLDAGVAVDEYQRGVVDYYAGAYQPAVEALERYLAASGTDANADANPDAHLFLAWSYERLGNVEVALDALEAPALDAARATFERAELLRRAGRNEDALAAYDAYLDAHMDGENAAAVAWSAALLAAELDEDGAAERFLLLADAFPLDPNAPRALSLAAARLDEAGEASEALAVRRRLIEQYPANIHAAETLFRLLLAAESGEDETLDAAELAEQVATLSPSNYFALRAADIVAGVAPFSANAPLALSEVTEADIAAAEAWLREKLAGEATLPDGNLGVLSPELAADPQRIVGEKLWQLGLFLPAKAELETVRENYAADPLANYQLARYFSELGLYRSSIVAVSSLLQQVGATIYDAPPAIGRLAFPVYYADLILPLAGSYGFDPRLQFALVRQESLFESFAVSGAAAQGLSQVIPDTGAWIAQRLGWPDYDNADLYKPYVGLNFGAYYLSEQLQNFDGHVHAALAAYNGGPGNAARWYTIAGADHDLFVDTIDFPETRLYIERIYEGFNAYRHLYRSP